MKVLNRGLERSVARGAAAGRWGDHSETRETRPSGEKEPDVGRQGGAVQGERGENKKRQQ